MTVAAVEAGGTKIVCAIGSSVEEIRTTPMRCVVQTADPIVTPLALMESEDQCPHLFDGFI